MDDEKNNIGTAMYLTFNTPAGKSVFAWILHRCGFFETDPAKLDPKMIAFANTMIQEMELAISGDMGKYMDVLMESRDLMYR